MLGGGSWGKWNGDFPQRCDRWVPDGVVVSEGGYAAVVTLKNNQPPYAQRAPGQSPSVHLRARCVFGKVSYRGVTGLLCWD